MGDRLIMNRKQRRSAKAGQARLPEFNQGFNLVQKGDVKGALMLFRKAAKQRPDADTLGNIGYCLRQLGRNDEALVEYRKALAVNPDHVATMTNLCNILNDQGDVEAALEITERAMALAPDAYAVLINRGSTLHTAGRYDDAQAVLRKAVALYPDKAEGHKNLGNILLLKGDLPEGFREYEWRLQFSDVALALDGTAFCPPWTGEDDLNGKTLLTITEQGMGDTLHFVRYAALVRARGGQMILTCQPAFERLLKFSNAADSLLCNGDPAPKADFHAPLLSLPRLFGTSVDTIPADVPYLTAAAEWKADWETRLTPRSGKPRVGLVWSGSATHKNDANRSMPAELLDSLLGDAQVDFVSLQVDMRPEHAAVLARHPHVQNPAPLFRDYADTAGTIDNLDLVLSVDTSVAHLAGAMGKPTWVMLPFVPDWRWIIGRDDTPWYPEMRLFRQQSAGDWGGVIARVKESLAALT